MITTLADWIATQTTPPEPHELERDGALPLRFTGWQVGYGSRDLGERYGTGDDRAIEVYVYVTTTGRLVTSVELYDGDTLKGSTVGVHDTPAEALAALHHKGKLPSASKTAWLEACDAVPALSTYAAEEV